MRQENAYFVSLVAEPENQTGITGTGAVSYFRKIAQKTRPRGLFQTNKQADVHYKGKELIPRRINRNRDKK